MAHSSEHAHAGAYVSLAKSSVTHYYLSKSEGIQFKTQARACDALAVPQDHLCLRCPRGSRQG